MHNVKEMLTDGDRLVDWWNCVVNLTLLIK